jgi:hypothetical protein
MSDATVPVVELDRETPVSGAESTPGPAYLLAGLSAGAAAIHLMMAPVHASASQVEAIGFALAGWFQAITAVLMIFRPQRRWFAVAGIGNALILAMWVWSRTKGLPIGSNPNVPEAAGGVDITAALFEGAIIVGVLAQMLPKPEFRMPAVVSAIAGVAVLVATTTVLVNPQTADHHAGDVSVGTTGSGAVPAQTASAGVQRCDQSLNPVAFWREAKWAGTDPSLADQTAPAPVSGGMDHHGNQAGGAAAPTPAKQKALGPLKGRGSAQLDKLIGLSKKGGEAAAGFAVAELANATDAEYEEFIRSLNASAAGHDTAGSAAPVDHTMGHLGPQQWTAMSDPADCEAVRKELARAKAVADKFPTAESATAAGYVRVAPYVPGIASHWMNFKYVDGTFNIDEPEMLLYDGNGMDARLTGLSYYVSFEGDTAPSQGFTGDNDLYHRHIGLCTSTAGVIGDSTTTDEECKAAGGRKSDGGEGWMSHAWVVPGCESPWGVFSGINPILDTKLSEQSGKNDGGCAGSAVKQRYNMTPANEATMPATTTTAASKNNEAAAGN